MAEGNCRWVCKVLSVTCVCVCVCVCVYTHVCVCVCVCVEGVPISSSVVLCGCVCGVWFCVYVHNNVTSSDMTACLFLTEQV